MRAFSLEPLRKKVKAMRSRWHTNRSHILMERISRFEFDSVENDGTVLCASGAFSARLLPEFALTSGGYVNISGSFQMEISLEEEIEEDEQDGIRPLDYARRFSPSSRITFLRRPCASRRLKLPRTSLTLEITANV